MENQIKKYIHNSLGWTYQIVNGVILEFKDNQLTKTIDESLFNIYIKTGVVTEI